MIMAFNDPEEQGRVLDSEQRIDARQRIGYGWSVRDVAPHYGMTELQLRHKLGLPQFISEANQEQQRSLFDDRGQA